MSAVVTQAPIEKGVVLIQGRHSLSTCSPYKGKFNSLALAACAQCSVPFGTSMLANCAFLSYCTQNTSSLFACPAVAGSLD